MRQTTSDLDVFLIFCAPWVVVAAIFVAIAQRGLVCSKEDRAHTDVVNLNGALKTFVVKTGRLPTEREGFRPLVDIQILEGLPVDPWNKPYALSYLPGGSTSVISSAGTDGLWGTGDDIVLFKSALPAARALSHDREPSPSTR